MPGGDELVEWVDEHDDLIDVVPRSRMRADNLRHRSVAVVVTTSDGRLVVQRRADTKDLFPGWWDIGAGGVVTAGEDRAVSAARELDEELGIGAELRFAGVGRHDDEFSREICHVFLATHDGPFVSNDGEAVEIRAVTVEEFAELSGRAPFLPGSLALLLPFALGFVASDRSTAPLRRLLRDPRRFAPWYNGVGVLMFVTGMMIAASALHLGAAL